MLFKLKPVKTESDPSFLQLRFLHFMIGELICQSFSIYSSDVVYVSSTTNNQHLSLSSTFKTSKPIIATLASPWDTLRASTNSKQFIIPSLSSSPNFPVCVDKICVWNCLKTPPSSNIRDAKALEIFVMITSSCLWNLLPHVYLTSNSVHCDSMPSKWLLKKKRENDGNSTHINHK